ncbi:MAG: murein transglycosylase A [Rubricella sp.]
MASAEASHTQLSFDDLPAWSADSHEAARETFLRSCGSAPESPLVEADEWRTLCDAGRSATDARAFFEEHFVPVLIEDGNPPLVTGYYEPELAASRTRQGRFDEPIYRLPPERRGVRGAWLTRAEIEGGALAGRGLELAWLEDPVDVFFLQVQGSGRLRMEDGSVLRIGYGGRNGHPYRSVGRHMVELGLFAEHQASASNIRRWVAGNGDDGRRILHHNPSFIFFRVVEDLPEEAGPVGALGVPVTAMRSIAVDPDYTPLGAPVWLETETALGPFAALVVAQDVGAAIRGAQRADLFFGSGREAGEIAGVMRTPGRLVTLLPRAAAARLTGE